MRAADSMLEEKSNVISFTPKRSLRNILLKTANISFDLVPSTVATKDPLPPLAALFVRTV